MFSIVSVDFGPQPCVFVMTERSRQSGVDLPKSVDNFNYVALRSDGLMASVVAEMK